MVLIGRENFKTFRAARFNNKFYLANKIFSVLIAFVFAGITLSFKS